jgi:Tannase and feruloyl esterase
MRRFYTGEKTTVHSAVSGRILKILTILAVVLASKGEAAFDRRSAWRWTDLSLMLPIIHEEGPHMNTRRLARCTVATIWLATIASQTSMVGAASQAAMGSAQVSCSALTGLVLLRTVITSATVVPAQGSVPEYCRVLATVEPETDIEVRLPSAWSERLLHLGGVGLEGVIQNLDGNLSQLQAGYALTASNGGHRDPTRGATRFLDNPTLIEDFAHGAIEKTVRVAKAVIDAYYGRRPKYSYFSGCSTGGREALNAAGLYSEEFDGVIAAAPPVNMSGLISRWAYTSRLNPPSSTKLAAMYQAQMTQCDGLDGLADGIISNPVACAFDPASLRCPATEDNDSCLTDQEIQTLQALHTDLTLENGQLVYPRFGIGNPATGLGVFMRVGGPGTPTFASLLAASFLPFIVYNDPTYDPAAYDIEIDLRTVVDAMEHTYDFSPNTTALAGYLRSGKKIIIWHGTEDMLVSHIDTIQAYETMTRQAGRDSENARFYALPGVQHCGGGPGTNRFDMIAAITDWVENGSAPQTPIASRSDAAGNLLFTRPLCEFPGYPRYAGQGDPNDASSFECVTPAGHVKNDD